MMIVRKPEYQKIARKLIRELPEFEDLKAYKPKIAFLASDEEKIQNRKLILGQCYKTSKTYSWICPYDFFIIVYEQNCLDFSEEQIETLIRHELHHVGIDTEGNEPSFYIKPHDFEEFREIIDDVGIDWAG